MAEGLLDRYAARPDPVMSSLRAREDAVQRPDWTAMLRGAGKVMEFVGPQADLYGMFEDANAGSEALQRGDYLKALGDYGLAAAAIPMMAMPFTVGHIKGVTDDASRSVQKLFDDVPPGIGHNSGIVDKFDLPPGSDPRYLGKAPDRSGKSYLRYRSKKGSTERVSAALNRLRDPNNPVRREMLEDMERGMESGKSWYNTEELRDWFMDELGPERGHAEWAQFLELVGAASPGSKVPANIRNAAYIRHRLKTDPKYRRVLEKVDNLRNARRVGRTREKGYGHKTQGLQELIAARQLRGEWDALPEAGVSPGKGSWTHQPKPKGFTGSLMGNERNMAADLHFTRYIAMASGDPDWLSSQAEIGNDLYKRLSVNEKLRPYFNRRKTEDGKMTYTFNAKKAVKEGKVSMEEIDGLRQPQMYADKPNDSEYIDFEEFMGELGEELGLSAGQAQAALWMGGAEKTNVDVSSQLTFMEALRNVAADRAAKTGDTTAGVLKKFIHGGKLVIPGGVAAGLLNSQMERSEDDAF